MSIESRYETLKITHLKSDVNKIFNVVKIKNKKKWTQEEDFLLISLAEKYKEKHWKEISNHFANKTPLQCFSRYKRIKPGIVKGTWSKEEDEKIVQLVETYGKAWSKISKVLITRNGKQIRDRFVNVLDPEVKRGKFTEEEDRNLIKLYVYYGPKWATISKHFPNRTADMIKNRFHSSIKKIFFSFHDNSNKTSKALQNLRDKYKMLFEESLTITDFSPSRIIIDNRTSTENNFRSEECQAKLQVCEQAEQRKETEEEEHHTNQLAKDMKSNIEFGNDDTGQIFNFEDYFTV